ncbi:hypothetical protein D5085_05635 [Ectothiorhodospiraceae bacterium BW-2]|nr:hypothetical protein D5085_05635 [Ectothiorhodospiraceae bacterium BW-2]
MKQTKLVTLAAAITVLTMSSSELMARGEPPRGGMERPDMQQSGNAGNRRYQSLQERLDRNGDGVITADDMYAVSAERVSFHFGSLDTDDNGYLTAEELDNGKSGEKRHRRIAQADIDLEMLESCLVEQLGEAYQARPTGEAIVAQADSDNDGQLNADEFLAHRESHAAKRFTTIDTSGDGVVDSDEVTAFTTQLDSRREAHRTCVEAQLDLDKVIGY